MTFSKLVARGDHWKFVRNANLRLLVSMPTAAPVMPECPTIIGLRIRPGKTIAPRPMRGDAVLAKVGFDNRGIQLALKSSPLQKARRKVRASLGFDTIAPSAPELARA